MSLPRSFPVALAACLTALAWLVAARAGHAAGQATPPGVRAVAAEVQVFSPEGSVKHVRQVAARFSAPMVALGDPRLADPFQVSCPVVGRGRWADPRNWVYDFDADLPGGIRCQFQLRAGLRTLSGAAVGGQSSFTFDTGGPSIQASLPEAGSRELDEDQVFLLRLDAPATPGSIQQHAYCAVEGMVERIPVELLQGQERQHILDERQALGYDYLRLVAVPSGQTLLRFRVRNRRLEQGDDRITVLRCGRHLPPGVKGALIWGPGIATASGLVTQSEQRLAFQVRPAFTAEVSCERTNAQAGCMPIRPITVSFTAPISREAALAIRLRAPDGRTFLPKVEAPAGVPTVEHVTFAAAFPEKSLVTVVLPPDLKDDAGRLLSNRQRFPLDVRVDAYPPLVKFSGTFAVLERREGGVLPVTVRNVEAMLPAQQSSIPARALRTDADPKAIARWLTRVEAAEQPSGYWTREPVPAAAPGKPATHEVWHETTGVKSLFGPADSTRAFTVPAALGGKPEEVVGIPLREPGFYVVELASRALGAALLGHDTPRYVATAALVTDLAVHFEWGRSSSLAWVTRLSDGRPVRDARVFVSDACTGEVLWQGASGRDGVAHIARSLGTPEGYGICTYTAHPLIVVAAADGDFTFTESTWDQGIEPYDFHLPAGDADSIRIYHTVLDRSLLRAGETVSMKHFVREHVTSGLSVPVDVSGPHRITVVQEGSDEKVELPAASFDAQGVATSQWKIPAGAKLGDYQVQIDGHRSADFRVAQFRLPSMRATIEGPARPLVAPQRVNLNLHVVYLSGGGAGGLPVKVRTLVEPEPQHFAGYDDYQFGGAPVHEGITTESGEPDDLDFESQEDQQTARVATTPVTLDGAGSGRLSLTSLPALAGASRLVAELDYADANGEELTSTGYVQLLPAAVSVGIRPESWIGSPDQLRFRVVALDPDGRPLAGQAIRVSLYQSSRYSYRKRLLGGFYTYETTQETRRLQPVCSGQTNAQGVLFCEVAPGVSGEVILRAETRDADGHVAGATTSMWVVSRDDWWFGGTSGDRMDVLPEKQAYEAGETARLQVRMPFRSATVLVTVEREGVLRSFVTRLHGKSPIVRVPIEASDAPNVFISVLAVRGRIRHAEAPGIRKEQEVTALVDLRKPAYRLGVTQIQVGWRPHRLNVTVQPRKTIFEARERAPVKIHVAAADGQPLPPGTEVAVAAVDEALLDLAPNPSWDLLKAMMDPRGIEVFTSTTQLQVLGDRHYGRKAVPQGGGGGRAPARELFNTLLFWQPRVPVDAHGDASVVIPLNDSLTSFRIVAIADGGADLFGTGSTTIRTTRDLILTSGLPPLVREGDRFAATFSVRNTTDHPLAARVRARAAVDVEGAIAASLAPQEVQLAPGQARDLTWEITAPPAPSPRTLEWDVTAQAVQGSAGDQLKIRQSVIPAVPVRTYQATLRQLTEPLSVPARLPSGALPGRGGLMVTLQRSLVGELTGVRDYMSRYPYACLEQQVSKAIALADAAAWDAVSQELPTYLDPDGLLRYFPSDSFLGDDGLTAYVLAIASEASWPLPDDARARMLAGLTGFVQGKIERDSALATADLTIRKLQALDALSRYGAARPAMLDSLAVLPNELPTSALLDWIGVLERTPGIPDAQRKVGRALVILRARLTFHGTTVGFSTERNDALWWLMISEDSNANRLLLATRSLPAWRPDLPRLVRGALARQRRGHWSTTVANAWGVLAMEKVGAALESTAVTGSTTIRYGRQAQQVLWSAPQERAGPLTLTLPWQGATDSLQLAQQGTGAPWVMIRATAALPLTQPLASGFKIARTLIPVEQHTPGHWTRGDVVRVHLDLEAQSDMTWVVVDDPIPAGASILGSGLGGDSSLLERGDRSRGWAFSAFEERRFEGLRAYYRFVPKGRWSLEYTVRLNNPGTFELPPTHIEAMYAPEMFADLPNPPMTVLPSGD